MHYFGRYAQPWKKRFLAITSLKVDPQSPTKYRLCKWEFYIFDWGITQSRSSNYSYIEKSYWKNFFLEIKFFARKIFKPLNKMGDHIVHIILKTFLNIPISLAVRASLGINNSLILVLYHARRSLKFLLVEWFQMIQSKTWIKSR